MSYLLNARKLLAVVVVVLDCSWRTERRDGFISYYEPNRLAIIALITTKNLLTNNLEQYTTLINPAIAVHFVLSTPNAFRTTVSLPQYMHVPHVLRYVKARSKCLSYPS